MPRTLAALALALAFFRPHPAEARHRTCLPVFIEGAGTVLICAPKRRS